MDVEGYEVIEAYDPEDGELIGFQVVEAPSWYKGGVDYNERDYNKLVALRTRIVKEPVCCRTCAWYEWTHDIEVLV
jgi:hypothetical protein